MTAPLRSLVWEGEALRLLDQTKLPEQLSWLCCKTSDEVADAIRILAVRGAPAIGVAAAYACVLAFREARKEEGGKDSVAEHFLALCRRLKEARPTAVNLSWAVRQMEAVFAASSQENAEEQLLIRARAIETEDVETCRRIGENGASLFEGRTHLSILTHCNTGALATAGIGTAFGVIATLAARGQLACAYADETRPLLQGARLTAAELVEDRIPCCLITDNMAASVMRNRPVDAVIVGADRIASNGDTANKIGTYGLAVLAAYHHIPFYIAAPFSTFDFSIRSGDEIVIEERDGDEVRRFGGVYTAPRAVPVCNPAFDVTPAALIAGIITERGVLTAPFEDSIAQYERSLSHE